MANSRKASFNLNNTGKASSDSRYINYKALQYAIIYGKKPNLMFLQDEEVAKKRIAELNAIYARGERPPLAEKYSPKNNNNKKAKKKSIKRKAANRKNAKITNKITGETYEFECIREAAEFLERVENDKTLATYEWALREKRGYKHYIFEVEGVDYSTKQNICKEKNIIAENIKTKERLEFENLNKCAEKLNTMYQCLVYRKKVKDAFEQKQLIDDTWKIYCKEVIE